MSSLLERLLDKKEWYLFLEHKRESDFFPDYEEKRLMSFIEGEEYFSVCQAILDKEAFPLPEISVINKKHTEKKRTVFVFDQKENYVLKLLAFLLFKYDGLFQSNLYSFRRKIGVKQALYSLIKKNKNNCLYGYKADIHDYFNSVDTEKMIALLRVGITDDEQLCSFIEGILREPYAIIRGEKAAVKKGIMAGVPISGFLADLYLNELDRWFAQRGIPYARYSDDIIVFAENAEKISEYEAVIKKCLSEHGLTLNPKKEMHFLPGEPWEFLGFEVGADYVDIAPASVKKLKDKLKRKAKALARWRKRKDAKQEWAVRAHIKYFNKKLYENGHNGELTWSKWYFPTVTTDKSLKELDRYAVECLRFVATGRHTKANYNLRYETLKELGYRSLVNEFYKYKKTQKKEAVNTDRSNT